MDNLFTPNTFIIGLKQWPIKDARAKSFQIQFNSKSTKYHNILRCDEKWMHFSSSSLIFFSYFRLSVEGPITLVFHSDYDTEFTGFRMLYSIAGTSLLILFSCYYYFESWLATYRFKWIFQASYICIHCASYFFSLRVYVLKNYADYAKSVKIQNDKIHPGLMQLL